MKKYAVFGNPVFHSKSPLIFNALFEHEKSNNHYSRVSVETPEQIIEFMDAFNLTGANITSPFKQSIIPLLDQIDNIAEKVGSVNTVIKKGEHLYGFNTDVYGVENSIISNGLKVNKKKCIVIGGGGAARAAVYALKMLGANVIITNRTEKKAKDLALKFNCECCKYPNLKDELRTTYLIVVAAKNISVDQFLESKDLFVLTADYSGLHYRKTHKVIEGTEWLIYQAYKAYQHFFDKLPDVKIMRRAVNIRLDKFDSLSFALSGISGSGKSSIGKKLSEHFKFKYHDLDNVIEKHAKKTIKDIFDNFGEKKFRELEEEEFKKLSWKKKSMISLGGGSVESPIICNELKDKFFVINIYKRIDDIKKDFDTFTDLIINRPMISKINIEELFKKRKDKYFKTSDINFIYSGVETENIFENIVNEVEKFIRLTFV